MVGDFNNWDRNAHPMTKNGGDWELVLEGKDALKPGARVVVVDDLLATGGTAKACAKLVDAVGAKVVKMLFVMELEGFAARTGKLARHDIDALIRYPGR